MQLERILINFKINLESRSFEHTALIDYVVFVLVGSQLIAAKYFGITRTGNELSMERCSV